MAHVTSTTTRRELRHVRYGLAVIAVCGLVYGANPAVAWADTLPSNTASESASGSEPDRDAAPTAEKGPDDAPTTGPRSEVDDEATDDETTDGETTDDETTDDDAEDSDELSDEPAPDEDTDLTEPDPDTEESAGEEIAPEPGPDAPKTGSSSPKDVEPEPESSDPTTQVVILPADEDARPAEDDPVEEATPGTALAVRTAAVATLPTLTVPAVTVESPRPVARPLSPIAELLELPGRLINVVLQVFDITSSATSPVSPIDWGPVNNAVFAAFREVERILGLHRTPVPQPVVPTLTYTGPTDRPTPTVGEFLNAATAGYVLGSTPGGLVPFTVNGFQLSSTNILTGMAGDAWVTPEGQVIIAYQGTTGGTHLAFNPVIAISHVLADLQMVFTPTTPAGFHDAVDFAELVQREAAKQGYGADDIFVTGHSLGGWQAQFVAQQIGLAGIGFEAPGMNSTTPGNGADSLFVNIGTYGDVASYLATDLPGLQPFMPRYVPGGGAKPHYGPIVMVGDPAAMTPLYNASRLFGTSLIGSLVFLVDALVNFAQYHMPGVQAFHLDIDVDPGITPWLGTARGPVLTGYGALSIPELLAAASDDGILFRP